MKRFAWFLVLTIALTSTTAFCAKEKKAKGNKGAKSSLRGEYAIMVKICELTDAQKTDLAAKVTACAAEAKTWREANADKLADIKKKSDDAKKAKDKDAMKAVATASKELRAEETKLKGAAAAAARSILTDEQKVKWNGFIVYRSVIGRLKKAEVTEAQDAQIRTLCTTKAPAITAADGKEKSKAYKELSTTIIDTVLTADQKAKLTAKREKPAPKDKKDGDKKPRKGKKDTPEV